jgi:hypothetical protein
VIRDANGLANGLATHEVEGFLLASEGLDPLSEPNLERESPVLVERRHEDAHGV